MLEWVKQVYRQQIKTFFENEGYYLLKRPGKRYYIICRPALGAGFFSNYYWVLGHVVFAKRLGYIPVVDMLNYKTLYSEDEAVDGEKNAWNYYFENVDEAGLEEAYRSNKYILARPEPLHKYANRYCDINYRFPSEKAIDYYYPIIKKHLVIKQSIERQLENDWLDLKKKGKIIGVHVRGTDMKNNLGHPMPADIPQYFEEIEKIISTDDKACLIFLATDEKAVIWEFKSRFEGISEVIVNEAFRSDEQTGDKKTGIHELKADKIRDKHKYKMGLEVLKDAWCLSRCNYLVCGHSNVTNAVILWNNHRFERVVCVENKKE